MAFSREVVEDLTIRARYREPSWQTDEFGTIFKLYPSDQIKEYLSRGSFFDDIGVLHFLDKSLHPNMIVVDVGAHWGEFSLFVIKRIQPFGTIHCFEPTRYSYLRLQENLDYYTEINLSAFLNNVAVSNIDNEVSFLEYPPLYSAWNNLGTEGLKDTKGNFLQETRQRTVKTTTLDSYCENQKIDRIDLLKIDVEGFEIEVIEGCSQLIEEDRLGSVIFEVSILPLNTINRTAEWVFNNVKAKGFDIQMICKDGSLESVVPSEFEPPYFANYLARRK